MPIYFRNAPVREPFIYDSIGNHWLQDATSRPNGYPFYHYLYSDAEWEAVREIIAKLKEECAVFHDFDGEAVDDFFDEYEDEIRDEIYSRNDSDVVKELVRHTDDIPIRVEMLSNYDWRGDGLRRDQSLVGLARPDTAGLRRHLWLPAERGGFRADPRHAPRERL